MIYLNSNDTSIIFTSDEKYSFPNGDGSVTLPKNSLILVVDESDYVTFRSTANYDVIATATIGQFKIDGVTVTKDNIAAKFEEASTTEIGGKIKVVIVQELPEEGEEGVIYLVPNKVEEGKDEYSEWIWVENSWEKLGNTKIDLDDYYTKEETDGKFDDYYSKEEVDNNFVKKEQPKSVILTLTDDSTVIDTFDDGVIPVTKYSGRTDIVETEITEGVTSIGEYAFYNCRKITSVTIPNSVTSIDYSAFQGCSGLKRVNSTVEGECIIPNSVTLLDNRAFYNCSGLKSVTIGSGVTYISDSAFQNCTNLTSVTIPNSVTSIGDNAFSRVRTEGTLICDEDWFNNLDATSKTNLGDVANWTRQQLPKTIEGRVASLESQVGNLSFVALTQAEYDELEAKDENTIYFIK